MRKCTRAAVAVAATMTAGTCLTAQAAAQPGHEQNWVPVPVVNGHFSQPPVTGTSHHSDDRPWYWGSADKKKGGLVVGPGPGRADRQDAKEQAARIDAVRGKTDPGQFYTRLWGVKSGSKVRVHFEYSPTTDPNCPKGDKPKQRTELPLAMEIEDKEQWKTNVPAPQFTGQDEKVGKANWQSSDKDGAAVEVTATQNDPKVSFVLPTDQIDNGSGGKTTVNAACHPMIAAVRAEQLPLKVDKSVAKNNLPPARAYKGNDPEDVGTAVAKCAADADCAFAIDQRYSYGYYAKPRPVGEVYINCTFSDDGQSAALKDTREITYKERSFDSISQSARPQFLENSSTDGIVPDEPTDVTNEVSQAEKRPSAAVGKAKKSEVGKAALHFAAAWERVKGQPWQWTRSSSRTIDVITPKGHASWAEVQAARERVEGRFTTPTKSGGDKEPDVYRTFAAFDGPSRIASDRLYQRHGSMTQTEINRCQSFRPSPSTPDNAPDTAYDPADGDTRDEGLAPGTPISGTRPPRS
ncbi:hypothetical protein [Streptomyces iconiensis]|uniref:Uncharacterized protein n=1 Tax=Streptomyces iconiensis TaxID=1384038 RepID=A0ABT6ZVX1_9ACTN|nr:hypothetical protein [Streptomyces iconiensis]MDJ1132761.1 hypothetical protein [Streptomyces iconiensis]